MAFTAVSEDIIVQEGTFAFDYEASGTVYAGQGVYSTGTMQVIAPTTEDVFKKGCVGVCAYGQTNGNHVAVYGPGNIVRIRVSGTTTAAGDILYLGNQGEFKECRSAIAASGVKAIALETQGTTRGECRVLLV